MPAEGTPLNSGFLAAVTLPFSSEGCVRGTVLGCRLYR